MTRNFQLFCVIIQVLDARVLHVIYFGILNFFGIIQTSLFVLIFSFYKISNNTNYMNLILKYSLCNPII